MSEQPSSKDLLTCPHCGRAVTFDHIPAHKHKVATFMPDAPDTFVIECVCGAGMCGHESEEEVRTRWNARAIPETDWQRIARERTADVGKADEKIERLERELSDKKARIDALMLEHCPDEVTGEQVEEWGKHQRLSPEPCDNAALPSTHPCSPQAQEPGRLPAKGGSTPLADASAQPPCAEPPYRVRSFWTPCRKYIANACVSVDDISIVDDNGKLWEPTGPEQDMTKRPTPTKCGEQS